MTNVPDNILDIYAMFRLCFASIQDVRKFALSALCEPIDDNLLQVAICKEGDDDCLEKAVINLFEKKGLNRLRSEDILSIFASYIASKIISLEISPRLGADMIASATGRAEVMDFHELDVFRYASSEMQDRPDDEVFFNQAILEEARFLVSNRQLLHDKFSHL
ncbi:hypothetical protein ACPVPU_01490 [Sphingomonas sp. CJ99]